MAKQVIINAKGPESLKEAIRKAAFYQKITPSALIRKVLLSDPKIKKYLS